MISAGMISNAEAHQMELSRTRVAIWERVKAAFIANGFTVVQGQFVTGGVARHAKLKDWSYAIGVHLNDRRGSSKNSPTILQWGNRAWKQRVHWTTDTSPVGIMKMVDAATEAMEATITGNARRAEWKATTEQADARKADEFKGVSIPPGFEIKAITGNGPDAGKYVLEMASNNPLSGPFTADQLKGLFFFVETFAPSHPYRVGRHIKFKDNQTRDLTHEGTIVKAGMKHVQVSNGVKHDNTWVDLPQIIGFV